MLPAEAGTLTVDMLDVGQGDALLLTSPAGKRVLIDAGEDATDTAEQLARLGVTRLDLVVATHPHADHVGGMREVVLRFDVGVYVDNGMAHATRTYTALMEAVESREIPYKPALHGQTFRMDDGIVITVLWPGDKPLTGTRSDLNSNSVVLRVDHGEDCMLFTGDSEAPTEQVIGPLLGQCDVLKVAHHGSNHSTTPGLLRTLDPDFALISVGQGNRYKHPGEETIERLKAQGVTIFRTDETGHVTLGSTGRGIEVIDGIPWWEPPKPVGPPPVVAVPATPRASEQRPGDQRASDQRAAEEEPADPDREPLTRPVRSDGPPEPLKPRRTSCLGI